jgi:hypothetical protein
MQPARLQLCLCLQGKTSWHNFNYSHSGKTHVGDLAVGTNAWLAAPVDRAGCRKSHFETRPRPSCRGNLCLINNNGMIDLGMYYCTLKSH